MKTRPEVIALMGEAGVIPLYYHPDPGICKKVITACYEGGMRIFEFTNRGNFAHEVFAELVKWASAAHPDLLLGAGSVVDAGTTSLYIQSGASFIVSPLLNEDMARVCNRRKIAWIPGCATVTEISRAEEAGADVVKIYPASLLGGPEFIRAIKGPCPWSQLMPSGGVAPTPENLKGWFDAGAYCVGMGSNLITSEIIKQGDYDLLRKNAKKVVEILKEIRKD